MRLETKINDMSLQLNALIAEYSQAKVNAEQREEQAKSERSEIKEDISELNEQISELKSQIMVQSRGSLGDSLSIRSD